MFLVYCAVSKASALQLVGQLLAATSVAKNGKRKGWDRLFYQGGAGTKREDWVFLGCFRMPGPTLMELPHDMVMGISHLQDLYDLSSVKAVGNSQKDGPAIIGMERTIQSL